MTEGGHRRGITVGELLASEHLGLRLLAGAGGLERKVRWTHLSEIPQPQLWLDGGELLITNGTGFPLDARGQGDFISRLAAKRLAGLALGVLGPELEPGAAAVADELDFPVLFIPKPTPFILITQLVAACNTDHVQRRMVTHLRLFDTLRAGCDPARAPGFMYKLEAISGYRLFLTSPSGVPLLPNLPEPPIAIAEILERSPDEVDRLSYAVPGGHAAPVPLGDRTAGFLIALEQRGVEPAGLGAVRHMATIAALLVSTLYRERELERRRGADVLRQLLAGTDADETARLLDGSGLESGPLRIAKIRGEDRAIDELHHRLRDLGVPQLMLSQEDHTYLVIEDASETLRALLDDLPLRAGVSAPFAPQAHWVLSLMEADRALERAVADGSRRTLVEYSAADSPLEWLPADPSVLRAFSDTVLAPLAVYDRDTNGSLLQSLRVYFECDRRLSVAAQALYVHKHTLAYRLKRVEEITGRRLTSMDDQCVLWLALKTSGSLDGASAPAAAPAP